MVSTLSGPIPPHPYYDKSDSSQYLNLPAPRVRPGAAEVIATKGTQGSVGMLFEVQGQRITSAPVHRLTPEPRNHIQENVRRMRRIQKDTKKKDSEGNQPVKALWKSSKFEHVQSKVKEELKKEADSRPQSASFLRAHSRTGFTPPPHIRPSSGRPSSARPASARSASAEPPVERLAIPKAETAREVKLMRHDIDFVKLNGRAVKHGSMKRSPSMTALDELAKKREDDDKNYKKGEVPKYLQERKKQWQQEEVDRLASIPDPEMPQAHRLLDDKERRHTLEKLQQTQRELIQNMASMPVRSDTLRLRQAKEALDRKMAEVEEAIKIFSRRKVFVKLDGE